MKTREEKEKLIQELKEKFSSASGYVLVNLLNLNTPAQKRLRNILKEKNSLFQVVKKTLVYKSNPYFPFEDTEIKFPFALIWNFDENLSAFQALKNLKEEGIKLNIVGGYLEGKKLTQKEVLEIVNLPSREELISKLYFILNNQFSRLHFVLSFQLKKLVSILSQIKK